METNTEPTRGRDGMAGENVVVLVLASLLVGLLIGHALGRRSGMTVSHVSLPGEAHAAMGSAPEGMGGMGNEDDAMAASAPPPVQSLDEARRMVAAMGGDVSNVQEMVDLGNRKFDNGRWFLAVAFYEKAVEANPNLPDVWCDMGIAYHNLDQGDEALRCFAAALERDPQHANSYFNRGVVLDSAGKPAEAEAAYRRFLELQPDGDLAQQAKDALSKLSG